MKAKWKYNYLIDAAMFLLMMAVAGIGLLMKYILLPGRDAHLLYGRQVEVLFLGMDRHVWGKIHFIVSLVLLALLALHIILHWNQVVCLFRNLISSRRVRIVTTWIFTGASIVLLAFPLVVRPELTSLEPLRQFSRTDSLGLGLGRYARGDTLPAPAAVLPPADRGAGGQRRAVLPVDTTATEHEAEHERTLLIQGYMSLQQVSELYEVPVSHLLEKLGIEDARLGRERLGWIRRSYNFTMSDIEDIIRAYWVEHPPSGGIPPRSAG